MVRVTKAIALLWVLSVVAACTSTDTLAPTGEQAYERPDRALSVVLIEPDITVNEVTAAGLRVPNAEWTELGKSHVLAALDRMLSGRNIVLKQHGPPPDADRDHPEIQLLKLHGAVGQAVLYHNLVPPAALPTKENNFDWTLGRSVKIFRDTTGADLALFIYVRDSFSSAGRVALRAVFAFLGTVLGGGNQAGFASLIDLETGHIIWFNRMASGSGDIRNESGADRAIELLLKDVPL